MSYATDFIAYALSIGALELVPKGRKIKSGRISPYFFNSGLFNTGNSLRQLSIAYDTVIFKNFSPEVIFGPSYKGSAIAVAVVHYHGGAIGYAYNRKEVKNHGEGGVIIGLPLKGKRVILVDDVMTTGDSLGEGINIIRVAGGIPIGVVIAFDRQERGIKGNLSAVQEFEKNHQIPVFAVATLNDLIDLLRQTIRTEDKDALFILQRILDYREQYSTLKMDNK